MLVSIYLVGAILDHLGPRVEEARRAGIGEVIIDPNLGIIHPETDDYEKIHLQLEIVWQTDRLRELGWDPSIDLESGLADTYSWFLNEVASGSETLRGFDRAAAPR